MKEDKFRKGFPNSDRKTKKWSPQELEALRPPRMAPNDLSDASGFLRSLENETPEAPPRREAVEFQVVFGYADGSLMQPMPNTTFSSPDDAFVSGTPLFLSSTATEMFIARIERAFRKAIVKTL